MMIAERKVRGGEKAKCEKKIIPNPFLLDLKSFSSSWEDAAMNHSFNSFIYFMLWASKAQEEG